MFASLVAQRLKRLPPMRETQVRSLGREDPLEKETVTHSSILALQSMGLQSRIRLSDFTFTFHLNREAKKDSSMPSLGEA